MLNKQQILNRVEWLLTHKDVANKKWFIEQFETLLLSATSPEKFGVDGISPACGPYWKCDVECGKRRFLCSTYWKRGVLR